MRKYLSVIILSVLVTACSKEGKVTITATFNGERKGKVYLEQSDVDKINLVDSADIKRGRVRFVREIKIPEFFQVGLGKKDFVSILAAPGERIDLRFGNTPLITDYSVAGSEGSARIKELDQRLFQTKVSLDSLKKIYSNLSDADLVVMGPDLEKKYVDVINKERKYTISFILDNINSMASLKAVYQRIDENTYVLYQPRDLQFLKIVSDTLSVKYPTSKNVMALKDNFAKELNNMYLNRLASVAKQVTPKKLDPDLLNTEGNRIKLSSLTGKYVLLTFWVTTSDACMNDLAVLKSLYKQYHGKGLEIYQISLDPDEARWKNVVKFEEIPWISVREDNPANPYYTTAYGVSQIPSNLLFDREGNLINTNLYGKNLQIKMDQLFNK